MPKKDDVELKSPIGPVPCVSQGRPESCGPGSSVRPRLYPSLLRLPEPGTLSLVGDRKTCRGFETTTSTFLIDDINFRNKSTIPLSPRFLLYFSSTIRSNSDRWVKIPTHTHTQNFPQKTPLHNSKSDRRGEGGRGRRGRCTGSTSVRTVE